MKGREEGLAHGTGYAELGDLGEVWPVPNVAPVELPRLELDLQEREVVRGRQVKPLNLAEGDVGRRPVLGRERVGEAVVQLAIAAARLRTGGRPPRFEIEPERQAIEN